MTGQRSRAELCIGRESESIERMSVLIGCPSDLANKKRWLQEPVRAFQVSEVGTDRKPGKAVASIQTAPKDKFQTVRMICQRD